jgi:ATP-dependent protease ClpP protease subunit
MKKSDIRQAFRERVQARLSAGAARWYDISNQDGDVAEIRIYDEIHWLWGISAEDFARELDGITAPEILVMINSPGGDVFDGIAIYNALRAHPAKVTTRVDGVAASIASVIAQAGDQRVMLTGSQMMIHEAWGITIGTSTDMRAYADLLDRQNENIAGIYARRASKEQSYFLELMKDDKWFNDQETVDEGLADEVVDLPPNAATAKVRPATNNGTKTLNDEVTEAADVVSKTIESARRVAALRAEKGKELSQVNRDSLDELEKSIEQLQSLLANAAQSEDEADEDLEREYARFVELDLSIPS